MAAAKGRKLKVFQAAFGFHESVVAAPSQAAALRAWGSHQNLFAEGLAAVTRDEAAMAAALAHPETPLRRAIGSNDPFQVEAASLPKAPSAEKTQARKPVRAPLHDPMSAPPPDRCELDEAERGLKRLEERQRRAEDRFSRRRDALRREQEASRQNYADAKDAAERKAEDARDAYRRAGGKD